MDNKKKEENGAKNTVVTQELVDKTNPLGQKGQLDFPDNWNRWLGQFNETKCASTILGLLELLSAGKTCWVSAPGGDGSYKSRWCHCEVIQFLLRIINNYATFMAHDSVEPASGSDDLIRRTVADKALNIICSLCHNKDEKHDPVRNSQIWYWILSDKRTLESILWFFRVETDMFDKYQMPNVFSQKVLEVNMRFDEDLHDSIEFKRKLIKSFLIRLCKLGWEYHVFLGAYGDIEHGYSLEVDNEVYKTLVNARRQFVKILSIFRELKILTEIVDEPDKDTLLYLKESALNNEGHFFNRDKGEEEIRHVTSIEEAVSLGSSAASVFLTLSARRKLVENKRQVMLRKRREAELKCNKNQLERARLVMEEAKKGLQSAQSNLTFFTKKIKGGKKRLRKDGNKGKRSK